MKICWFGFLGKNHSWSIVAQNISREFIKMGLDVDLFSTNGISHFPEDLKKNLKGFVDENDQITSDNINSKINVNLKKEYDMQLSYTAMKNFTNYFTRGNKNRFGIWNYETTVLPPGFVKHYTGVDKVIPSSNFSKKIFTDNGVPENHQVVIPHGIDLDRFNTKDVFPLKTKKKCKILANIAQPHHRKNINGLLNAYGKVFNKNDDVCLVLKISKTSANNQMAINFDEIFRSFRERYKNHAEVELITYFIDDIEPLYNAVDIVYTMTHAECFWMPGLEGFASNKIVVSPRYGGQLDYMNDENSILIEGKEIRAINEMQYWHQSPYAKVFDPDINDAANKLKEVVKNYGDYHKKFSPKMMDIIPNYTWRKVASKFLLLCK